MDNPVAPAVDAGTTPATQPAPGASEFSWKGNYAEVPGHEGRIQRSGEESLELRADAWA